MKRRSNRSRSLSRSSKQHFAFFLSFLSLSLLEPQTKMNFKLQAKKTPFQRHKEEQELKRKVNLEGKRRRERLISFLDVGSEKKLNLNLDLDPVLSHSAQNSRHSGKRRPRPRPTRTL